MTEDNILPLDAIVPGGERYKDFQPDRYASVMVRGHVVALVDAKGDLSLCHVDDTQPKLTFSTLHFTNEQLLAVVGADVKPTKEIALSGLTVSEACVSLYVSLGSLLVRLNVVEGALRMAWRVSTSDWTLTSTDGEGTYLFVAEGKEEIYRLDPDGGRKMIYVEKDPSFTVRKTPSRNEFGIEEMFFLSPDKRKVAFYRLNETSVTEFPVTSAPNGSEMPRTTLLKYPFAGTKQSEQVEVGILDVEEGSVTWLKNDGEICYWIGLTWSPDSQSLFCYGLNRSQQRSRLLQFDATTGGITREILCEEDSKYVEPEYSPLFIDAQRFLFQSRTFSGYNHIYLYDLAANRMEQITQGNWEVTHLLGYSAVRDQVLYLATRNTPLNRDFFATKLSDGVTVQVSPSVGTHQVYMDGTGPVWVDEFQSENEPGVTTLGSLETYGDQFVLKRSRDPYEGYQLPERIVGILPKGKDSDDDLYYRIVKPRQVKEGERLPVVFYVYGGPHVQLITNTWGSGTKGFEEMMADAGCVTFCIDPHGSYNRGHRFESEIRDDLNGPQMRDYKYALNWLFLTHDYVDRNRVAIYGWSFGGFMTLSMLLCSGFPFKVGVAGGAVVSWRYYETMYTERYMSLDKEGGTSGEHFTRTDMAKRIGELKTPLRLIHCLEDPVVLPLHWQYLLAEANKRNDVAQQIECYFYPGHEHNVRGVERVRLMEKVRAMIFDCL